MMEENNGFVIPMGKDPLIGFNALNVSVLRPYGVWLVVSPFNFPFALTGGPMGAALAAGNAVDSIEESTDTSLSSTSGRFEWAAAAAEDTCVAEARNIADTRTESSSSDKSI